jgi:hypothetical protein
MVAAIKTSAIQKYMKPTGRNSVIGSNENISPASSLVLNDCDVSISVQSAWRVIKKREIKNREVKKREIKSWLIVNEQR